jgi:hypothetical protein
MADETNKELEEYIQYKKKKVTVEQAKEIVESFDGKKIPVGKNGRWVKFIDGIHSDDELWTYEYRYNSLFAGGGLLRLRQGKVVELYRMWES